jgi:DNA-binding GntR family transcriptional regulator
VVCQGGFIMPKPTPAQEEQDKPFEPTPNTLVFEDTDRKHGFVVLDKLVLYAKNISKDAKILYAYLLGYAYEKDHCFPGYAVLCADLQASENTVRKAMRELEAAGLLSQKRQGLGKPNVYTLLSLNKAKIILQEHHQQSRTSKFEVQEPQKTTLLEPHDLRSNKEELKEIRNEEIYPSNIRKAKSEENDYVNSNGSAEEAAERTPLRHNERVEHSQTHSTTQNRNVEKTEAKKAIAPAEKRDVSASATSAQRKGGLAHIGQTLQGRLPVATPAVDDTVAREAIESYIRDIAAKLHDEAPLKSSATRAFNLYRQTGADLSSFFNLLYDAEKEANRRSATIKKVTSMGFKNRMAYFFAILEDKLGVRHQSKNGVPAG